MSFPGTLTSLITLFIEESGVILKEFPGKIFINPLF